MRGGLGEIIIIILIILIFFGNKMIPKLMGNARKNAKIFKEELKKTEGELSGDEKTVKENV